MVEAPKLSNTYVGAHRIIFSNQFFPLRYNLSGIKMPHIDNVKVAQWYRFSIKKEHSGNMEKPESVECSCIEQVLLVIMNRINIGKDDNRLRR